MKIKKCAGEKIKDPGKDFIDQEVTFHFIEYFARALETKIHLNEEIAKWRWFSVEEALQLLLANT